MNAQTASHTVALLENAHSACADTVISLCNRLDDEQKLRPDDLDSLASALATTLACRNSAATDFCQMMASLKPSIVHSLLERHPTLFNG